MQQIIGCIACCYLLYIVSVLLVIGLFMHPWLNKFSESKWFQYFFIYYNIGWVVPLWLLGFGPEDSY